MHNHGEFGFIPILIESITITSIIFVLMIIVELLELKYSSKLKKYLTGNFLIQNITSTLLGATPGCAGVYVVDSLYMAGIVGFGSIVAATVTTFGDEAFFIFAKSPKVALILVSITIVLGIIAGYLARFTEKVLKLKFKPSCSIEHHHGHEDKMHLKHFFSAHIWTHIFKKHIWKMFLWIVVSLLLIAFLNEHIHLTEFLKDHQLETMLIAAIVGLLPISGPNIFFITLYLNGDVNFSILLVSSIVQDGHGLLPILGYSLEDAFKIKLFNIIYGLSIGLILLAFNL